MYAVIGHLLMPYHRCKSAVFMGKGSEFRIDRNDFDTMMPSIPSSCSSRRFAIADLKTSPTKPGWPVLST